MAIDLLFNALIFLASAVIIVPLVKRLGLGEVLGYLIAGVIIGPSALGLVPDAEEVLHFSEVGIVFLLFVIGLELKPARLKLMRKPVLGFGGLQMLIGTLALSGLALVFGLPPVVSLVVGFSLALCSTALVLQLLGEQGELNTRHGRLGFADLLFQDMATIPVIALLPLLAGGAAVAGGWQVMLREALIGLAAFATLIIGGRYLLRPLFRAAAATRSRQVFTGTSLMVVIGAALAMELVGLSMALGAFLAGVLLADSEYRHSIEADIEPFRGLLLGLFFMAVGMTAPIGQLVEQPGVVLGLTALLLVTKWLGVVVAARAYGVDWRDTLNLAALLPQGGEFAFVLLTAAASASLVGPDLVGLLVLVVSLSMAATPLLFQLHARLLRPRFVAGSAPREFDKPDDHAPRIIIAGFGRFGQVIGRTLQGLQIPYTILDINAEHVDFVRRYGNQIYFGDASRLDLLEAAGADRAHILVIAIGDVETSLRIVEKVQRRFPRLRIFARARNRHHAQLLMRHGVLDIIRDLLPASLELTQEILVALGVDRERARHTVATFRQHDATTLLRQMEVPGDEAQQIQTLQQAAQELEELFEADKDVVTEPPAIQAERSQRH
ncbi:monovalent cation:proton antiporter-2 (CPA2) family protein [Halomonas sp. 18H]|nr:monovalent cation:proton antiporter-2 (CPA2) family protein [Halomonas sp. 18H]MCW4152550.1 monovalent cation:proton antiporter-2 (CPA2) family protein [Halomonas sp. 18H]